MGKVIIDGVNISNDGGCECDQNPNCYYKQLQRLKEELRTERIHSSQIEELEESLQHAKAENKELSEENSKLKGELDAYKMSENEANEIIVELKAENERLKKELKCYEMSFVANLDRRLADRNLELNEENEKYKQALQEIREIIDFRFKTAYMTFGYKEYDKLIEDIDKIINEVIGAE